MREDRKRSKTLPSWMVFRREVNPVVERKVEWASPRRNNRRAGDGASVGFVKKADCARDPWQENGGQRRWTYTLMRESMGKVRGKW